MITLIDGRQYPLSEIFFNPSTYTFTSTRDGENLTFKLYLTDKEKFEGFDRNRWFTILSDLKRTGQIQPDLPTSTLGIFWDQITTDPLAAPLNTLNTAVNRVFAAPAVIKIGVAIGLGLLVWFAIQKAK